jgi:hypothetical protein
MIRLKNLQKYRGSLLIFAGLILAVLVISIISSTSYYRRVNTPPLETSPLPPTAPFSDNQPQENIDWKQVRINQTEKDTNEILGEPIRFENLGNNTKTNFYKSYIPQKNHQVVFVNNRSAQIKRVINERVEKITPSIYRKNYGIYSILRKGVGNVWQLESYRISADEYLILEFDTQYNQAYTIYNLNASRYNAFVANLSQNPPREFYSNDDAI